MENLINAYIESKRNAWSKSTLKSELQRLTTHKGSITGDPVLLMSHLASLGAYTRVTTYIRISCFWDFLIKNGNKQAPNPYRDYRETNRNLFANSYERTPSRISYDECLSRIGKIDHNLTRDRALALLQSGCRYHELENISGTQVRGKGGKIRPFLSLIKVPTEKTSYSTFQKELSKVGLKSHDLRKAFASRLAERGMTVYDLCRVMGWSQIDTALCYVQTKKDSELKAFIEESTNGPIRKSVQKAK